MKTYKGYKYSKVEDTYIVYTKEGKPWIVGFKTEEDVKVQIDDLVLQEENRQAEISIEERVSALEDLINMQLGF